MARIGSKQQIVNGKKSKKKGAKPLNRATKSYVLKPDLEWNDTEKDYLVIVDVSSVMRTYDSSPFSKDMSYVVNGEEMRTGAMFGLFRVFSRFGFKDNIDYVFCFDSSNGLLKQIDKNYKAERVKVHSSYFSQVNTMYKILEEVGYKVMLHSGSIKTDVGDFKNAGIEADHCIAFATEQNYDFYDEIAVISGDHDLTHLVDDKVMVVNPLQARGDTTKQNYAEKMKCPYNSILLMKSMVGDKSDNIKGINRFGAKSFENFVNEQIPEGMEIRGNEEEIILQSDLEEDKKFEALYSLKLVLPFKEFSIYNKDTGNYEEIDAVSLPSEEVDYQMLSLFLEKYGMNSILTVMEKEGRL